MTPRMASLVAWWAGLTLIVAACGIQPEAPEALATDDHQDLLFGTTTTPTTVLAGGVDIRLFFIGEEDQLESVIRPYEDRPRVTRVLADLEESPRGEEQVAYAEATDGGTLRTVVPLGLEATLVPRDSIETAAGVRVIAVNPEADLRGRLEADPVPTRLIVSQLVCTFLNLNLVDDDGDGDGEEVLGVQINDDQGQITLTDNDGQLLNRPVTLEDFGGCKTGSEERAELLETESTTTTGDG